MLVVGDALDAFYLGAFLFGLLFSFVSHLGGALHLGAGHGAAPTHPPPASGSHPGGSVLRLGPFNPLTLVSFLPRFGGVGYQARHALGLATPANVLCGLLGGPLGGGLVWLVLAKVFLPGERTLDPNDYRLNGAVARVSSGIRPGGTGEIVYEQAGGHGVSAARLTDDGAVPRGAAVRVLAVERGIAFVEPLPFGGPPGPASAAADGSPTG